MNSSSNALKWKISTCLFAATTIIVLARSSSHEAVPDARADIATRTASGSHSRAAALRSLRIPARAIGVSERQLIADLKRAKHPRQIAIIAEKMGFVGTDRSVEALSALIDDRRPGVAAAALMAIGHIGTEGATKRLLDMLDTVANNQQHSVIMALAKTGRREARNALMKRAQRHAHPQQYAAVMALGELGGPEVVAFFDKLIGKSNWNLTSGIIYALAAMGTSESEALLLELRRVDRYPHPLAGPVQSPDRR